MKFEKTGLSIPQQIARLKERGMIFENEQKATHYLSNISYYRLSAYWFTFLEDPKSDHIFKDGTTFEATIATYVFDRKLRLLIFDEIERIEIALRTQIIYHYCLEFGNNWYEEASLFRDAERHEKFNDLLQKEVDRTNEIFIKHYLDKYTDPPNPPCWMALELASLGQLSILFKNLRSVDARKKVARHFEIHENVFESWLETLSFVRNSCAHHSRLWNRKLPKKPIFPAITTKPWIREIPSAGKENLIYGVLAIIRYLYFLLYRNHHFKKDSRRFLISIPTSLSIIWAFLRSGEMSTSGKTKKACCPSSVV